MGHTLPGCGGIMGVPPRGNYRRAHRAPSLAKGKRGVRGQWDWGSENAEMKSFAYCIISSLHYYYMVRYPRGSYIVYPPLSLKVAKPEKKTIHWTLSSICESPSKAVLSRMQLTFHTSRSTPHGALRLVREMSAWSVKAMLHPGIVWMRGSIVIRLRPCMT